MTEILKGELPKHIVDEYNRIQSEVARELNGDTFFKMLPDGKFKVSNIPKLEYTLGVDWDAKKKKGTACLVYSHNNLTPTIDATITINVQSKNTFEKIVEGIAEKYGAKIIIEK